MPPYEKESRDSTEMDLCQIISSEEDEDDDDTEIISYYPATECPTQEIEKFVCETCRQSFSNYEKYEQHLMIVRLKFILRKLFFITINVYRKNFKRIGRFLTKRIGRFASFVVYLLITRNLLII